MHVLMDVAIVLGVDDGAATAARWGVLGVVVAQIGLIVLAVINKREIRKARTVAESTNESVNGVKKGEPNLINKMRGAEHDISYLKASHKWQTTVLIRLAHSVGITVEPPPVDPTEMKETP